VNIPLIAYRTVLGEPVESVGATGPAVAWRSSIKYRPGLGVLSPGTRIVDGYFRRADPLPGLYHYLGTPLLVRVAHHARRLVRLGRHGLSRN
jgi:hypothetical protein